MKELLNAFASTSHLRLTLKSGRVLHVRCRNYTFTTSTATGGFLKYRLEDVYGTLPLHVDVTELAAVEVVKLNVPRALKLLGLGGGLLALVLGLL